jgi:hypothetical protein
MGFARPGGGWHADGGRSRSTYGVRYGHIAVVELEIRPIEEKRNHD